MTDNVLDNIPTVGDHQFEPEQFPEIIEPMDSEWWLLPEQKQICDVYLGECRFDQTCAVQAVRTYKNPNSARAAATRFFKQARVRRYLWIRTKQLTKKFEINQEEIIRDLIEVKEMAMGRKPTHIYATDKHGNIYPDYVRVANLAVAKQTLEQLGKFNEIAMWNEKDKGAGDVQVINFNFDMRGQNSENVIDDKLKVGGMTIDVTTEEENDANDN
jgi:hypothetical protein